MQNRIALITGGRIKIGYQTALRFLRDGARVIITTRFAQDALKQYKKEPDFDSWQDRLKIYSLDLRNLGALHHFVEFLLQNETHLDILINNAAQTITRPLVFYQHLLDAETDLTAPQLLNPKEAVNERLLEANTQELTQQTSNELNQTMIMLSNYFPTGMLDEDGQQLDLREHNSWLLHLEQVSSRELLEVQLVNSISPFILCSKLKPLMIASPHTRRFIVNVSAMEGQFNREHKTVCHPHTNMAKASLNMLTRTSASDYAESNIYMNSVDTGWITNENPHPKSQRMQSRGFEPPLDIIDGMARIYDPICQGLNQSETPLFGLFLKDYAPCDW